MTRPPAVAGKFYPADPRRLRGTIRSLLDPGAVRAEARAVLVPHAGYVYSGACAGRTYSSVSVPERLVILCPNHTGMGASLATDDAESWETPLGRVPLDGDLVARLQEACPGVVPDGRAHRHEHALEVQLPFLQVLRPGGFRFAPVCVGTGDPNRLAELGRALASVIADLEEPCLLVVSSDMTHYEPFDSARRKDRFALERLESLDASGLCDVVRRKGISMCGWAPAVAALTALRAGGAHGGRLVEYTHSGVVTGDDQEVVAYAGMVFA